MSNSALGYRLERRTCEHLQEFGYLAERVARRGFRGGGDMFGCVDIVAVNAEGPIFGQVTTKSNASARRRKIRAAGVPWPVRLFKWEKLGGRWVMTSEEVYPEGAD